MAAALPTSFSLLAKQMVAGGLAGKRAPTANRPTACHVCPYIRSLLLLLLISPAGAVADAATYPMMTIKSRMQVQGTQSAYSYSGPLQAASTIIAKEGWRSLYKGFSTVLQTAPAQALYMGSYQAFRAAVPVEDSPAVEFCGGIVATLGQSLLMVPLEVVRQRQQVQMVGREGVYKGSLDAARAIYRQEGTLAFYRGFVMTQVRVPYSIATKFYLQNFTYLQTVLECGFAPFSGARK